MNKSLIVALALASSANLMTVQAQTYQWKDASGKTIISDTPPPANVRGKRSIGVQQPTAAIGTSAPENVATKEDNVTGAPQSVVEKSAAEQEIEFRKRQQEAREKEKEAAALKEKRDICERARNNYRMLQSDAPINKAGKDGEVSVMNNTQRRQEMERTRRIMQETCK